MNAHQLVATDTVAVNIAEFPRDSIVKVSTLCTCGHTEFGFALKDDEDMQARARRLVGARHTDHELQANQA